MSPLDALTTPRRLAAGRHAIEVPDGWQQGRGAYGGLVLAALARAAVVEAAAPERSLRTLSAELLGPVLPGPADIQVETLRAGSGVTSLSVRLLQGGELRTHAVAVLGRRRADGPPVAPAVPARTQWRECPVVPEIPAMPPFARHFEYRLAGPAPFSAGPEAHAAGWVRPLEPGPTRDEAFLVAMADVWWPAYFSMAAAPRPAATLTFTVDVVGRCDGLDPTAPFFHEAHTLASHEGYLPELRTLRGEDGRLLALNHQAFVIL